MTLVDLGRRAAASDHAGAPTMEAGIGRGSSSSLADDLIALIGGSVAPGALLGALRDRRAHGVGLIDALLAQPGVDAGRVVAQLARRLRVAALRGVPRKALPMLNAEQAGIALRLGMARLADGRIMVAVRGAALERLVALSADRGWDGGRIVLAAPRIFADTVMAAGGRALADAAVHALPDADPGMSARNLGATSATAALLALFALVLAAATLGLSPGLHGMLTSAFFGLAGLRFMAAATPPEEPPVPLARPARDLPVYTVLVPLYREGRSLPGLVRALGALDYPATKLDIKLLLEASDRDTRTAAAALALPANMEVLVLPPGTPRTKPRALNVGLAAARGDYLVIYDAEDRPEPDQLRRALDAFRAGGPMLACVQARLAIDNTEDGFLTRMFTIEYAALFDALLPALAARRLMFPLGGTSNHFRTRAIRDVGGWDAWNVTEDADLGVRLARSGHRLGVISSTTLEEAPRHAGGWIRQRTRWLKGYLMTWCVHMRSPVRLARSLGWRNLLVFHAFIGGVPLASLAVGACVVSLLWHAVAGTSPISRLDLATLAIGIVAAGWLGYLGIRRRHLDGLCRLLPALPLYWLFGFAACLRGLWQLTVSPHGWEKTEHGLALTSRTGAVPSHGDHSLRRSSAATSVSGRFRFSGATKRPSLSMR